MKLKLKKVNPIDVAALIIIIALGVLVAKTLLVKNQVTGRNVLLTIETSSSGESDAAYNEAVKLPDVYVNTVNTPVKTKNVIKKTDVLDVEVLGRGEVNGGVYIFNGERVLIGQKAEVHGPFFVQGYIKGIRYAD